MTLTLVEMKRWHAIACPFCQMHLPVFSVMTTGISGMAGRGELHERCV